MSYQYIFFEHTADIAYEAEGTTIEELFIAAAYGWKESVLEEDIVNPVEERKIKLEQTSPEELLVYFLDELNFLLNTKRWVLSAVKNILIENKENKWRLTAGLSGEPLDSSRHDPKIEVKAVTFHQMEIKKDEDTFKTKIVFDI